MDQEHFDELEERSSAALEEKSLSVMQALEAKQHIQTELEAMRSEEKILVLSEEERFMIYAFRAFKMDCGDVAVFTWQTRRRLSGAKFNCPPGAV